MGNLGQIISFAGFISPGIILFLCIVLMYKIERIKQLQNMASKLRDSVDEMDEQAKLIVRTDLELNKTQEALNKKLNGLYGLQKLSRKLSSTLQEEQLFTAVDPAQLEELGFEKGIIFLYNETEKKFILKAAVNYQKDNTEVIKSGLDKQKELFLDFMSKEKAINSSVSAQNKETIAKINSLFKTTSFVIAALLPKEGNRGFIFLGNEDASNLVTEGDEEVVNILATQLAQGMENARLFDESWRTHQELEKKVEERTHALSLALEELKIVSKRKTDFISSVSHELRTPLTSIKGYAAILLTEKLGALPPPVKERLEKINRHSDELTHFINDLLDISRIESGRVILNRQAQSLRPIAEKVFDLLSVQLKERQINSELIISPELPQAIFDTNQIERIFINIIGNALKFTPPEGKITVNICPKGNMVEVNISDTGCGIPVESQEAIFEEFYRVDNLINQKVTGTGLGLTLVKKIIEAHEGKIWVKSSAGKGSTFSFTLPASPLK
mgnify:FL=1